MFPSNLHKNIVQLDRQISLLENECKNMEVDKRKKSLKSESCYGKSTKNSGSQLKSSPVKLTLRNSDFSKRNKKIASPISGKPQSASSLPSHCSQSWSDTYETAAGKKSKVCKINTIIPACSCRRLNGVVHCDSRKKDKGLNCDSFKEGSTPDLHKVDNIGNHKHKVLHKESLYPHSGGTIEVTITQKPGSGKQTSPVKKTFNLEDEKGEEGCKCQIKGQKWSEILCLDTSKRKTINKENFVPNKFSGDETKTINQPFTSHIGCEGNRSQENINNSNNISNLSIQEENLEVPVKLSPPPHKIKNQQQIISKRLEKEVQCALENIVHKQPVADSKDPVKIIQYLVNQLKQMPIIELKELPNDVRAVANKTSPKKPSKELPNETKELFAYGDTARSNTSLEVVKQQCENLIKDKELLSKELAAKDIIIATMSKREEEYLSLINGLKLNLEKTRQSAQGNIETIKEMNILKDKLLEKMKFTESVQRNYNKAHDLLEKYIMENQKLKTQIKILILEAQKHEVLLAGKEAEINKYKEEILNFQRQISDHLAILKSNAQGIDVEKMVQAIFQQSQIFLQTDLDSVLVENNQKDTSKQQNILMHSSPTSSKTSVVNSSWKQISSIHDQDQSKANSDINLNDDSHAKDFFQIFGDNSSPESKSTKKSKETLLENLLHENIIKRSLSFTSCMSVHDDQNSNSESSSIHGESSASNSETLSNEEKAASDLEKTDRVSFERAQSNIDEVLKNMKLNFSKKIFETSLTNGTIDDFLGSQISSASQ